MAATDTTPKAISQKVLTHILSAIKSFIPTNISELKNDKNYVTADAVATSLENKQDTLIFDTVPTANSLNPVTSSGVKKAIDNAGSMLDRAGELAVDRIKSKSRAGTGWPCNAGIVLTDDKIDIRCNDKNDGKITFSFYEYGGPLLESYTIDVWGNFSGKAMNIPTSDVGGNIWIS